MKVNITSLFTIVLLSSALTIGCNRSPLSDIQNEPGEIVDIDLSYSNLTSLPGGIDQCKNLESISLVGNKLKKFPEELIFPPFS